jgi:hypothetical protein
MGKYTNMALPEQGNDQFVKCNKIRFRKRERQY